MLRGYRLKEKETDAYCTVFNTGNRPVPMFLELAVICVTLPPFPVSYLHLLLERIYSSCTLFPALLARCCSNCRWSVLFWEGGTRSSILGVGNDGCALLPFLFLSREKALARKMGTAGCYLRHLVLPPVLYSRSPTYPCKRPRIPHRHLTRVFNATGHGISAWTRPRARPESRLEPRLALLSYGGSA